LVALVFEVKAILTGPKKLPPLGDMETGSLSGRGSVVKVASLP
jgi:hypothetical protein